MAHSDFSVKVQFIDDASGEALGFSEMAPDSLPETFELDTTLEIGDDDWNVVDAQPKTRAEYVESKTLTLRLRRLEKIDPSKLMYTMATICDRLPPLGESPVNCSDEDVMLHEDDWCQVEFVAAADQDHIATQVAEIHQFKIDNWSGEGWKNIFVRPDHPTKFASLGIGFDTLQKAFSGSAPGRVLVFQSFSDAKGSAREVVGGFSFRGQDGLIVYGHHVEGVVASLAASLFVDNESEVESISKRLLSVGQLGPLLLVDWNTDQAMTPTDKQEIERWLSFLADPG